MPSAGANLLDQTVLLDERVGRAYYELIFVHDVAVMAQHQEQGVKGFRGQGDQLASPKKFPLCHA
jgi:hypothetical protein